MKGKIKKRRKALHLEGGYVSIQQWKDQSFGFQTAGGHESEGKQSLDQKSADDSLAGYRKALCEAVYQPQRQRGKTAASGFGSLHHLGRVRFLE